MMKIKTADGTWISGETADDLVRQMHAAAAFDAASTDQEWMRRASARALMQDGKRVRFNTAKNFVADLAAAGLIQVAP